MVNSREHNSGNPKYLLRPIRIYHECEGRIDKSVPMIAVWHNEACRVMTNGDNEGRICLSYPHTNNGFFFLLTTVFIYLFIYFRKSFQKSLKTPLNWDGSHSKAVEASIN